MPQPNPSSNKVAYLWQSSKSSQNTLTDAAISNDQQGMGQEDVTLLQEICNQSSTALMQFYQRYNKIILGFAMSNLANEADCSEILNDVLLTVWSNARSFGGRSSVRTWVLGITHHKTMDYLRKHHRVNRTRNELGLEQESNVPEDDVAQAMAALDDAAIVKACLQQLSPTHREVLHLAFYEDLSCGEIAEVIECPLGTVKTRLMHAKNKMKQLLSLTETAEVQD